MNRDRYDLPLTTASDRAAAHYRDGVDRMLSAWHGAEDAFDQAIARRSGLRAGAYRARPPPSDEHGRRRGARHGGAGPATGGRGQPARTRHVEIMAAVIEGKPKLAVTGAEEHLENIRAMRWCCRCCSARSASTPSPAAPTTTPQARDLRAPRQPLWRGLVVPQLSRLVAYRGRQSRHRPRTDRTRDVVAIRKRQRRTWPLACDVRAGRHGGRPKFLSHGCRRMTARASCTDICGGTSR